MDDGALAAIADRLYAGSLDDFVAARAAAAKEVAGGNKDLAAAVRALPKPSVAAWALNMLARDRPEVVAELGGLGSRMRAAQDSLDAGALRALGRERRTMLADAVDAARTVAREQGRAISDAMASDVEETLRALTADEGAANAVASGRLLKVLSADGVNDVDLDGAVALPGLLPAASPGVPASARGNAPKTTGSRETAPKEAAPKETAPKETAWKATAGKTRTTSERTAQPKPTRPRLEAVRQTPRPTSPPALERAKAALVDAQAAEEEASRRAAELQDQEEQTRTEIAGLQQETAELRTRLKAAEESLDRSRKRLAATSAEAKQAARAAGKASRTAMLAQERVLRLGSQ